MTAIPNVLAARYASPEMADIWAPEGRVRLERELWVAVLRAQADLGVDVPDGAIEAYEAVIDDVDLAAIAARERVLRHDVKARIEEFCALAGFEVIHRGMTSRDVTENVEQLQVRRALTLVRDRIAAALVLLAERAVEHRDLVVVGRSHNMPAQPTTLGKRLANVGQELMAAFERVEQLLARQPLRGLKGPVGTQADLVALLGDPAQVEALEARIAEELGFERRLDAVGQVYPRSLDLEVVGALVQTAAAPSSFANTVRLMAGDELVTEGFAAGQVGSSAMPHKMNPRSCERIVGFKHILEGHFTMIAGVAGGQWFEGDVSCSVVRRVALPDAFLAADGLLETFLTVLQECIDDYLRSHGLHTPDVPTLQFLSTPVDDLRTRTEAVLAALGDAPADLSIVDAISRTGGGTMPKSEIPSLALRINPHKISIPKLAHRLRTAPTPVVGYIENDAFHLNLRSVFPQQDATLAGALKAAL